MSVFYDELDEVDSVEPTFYPSFLDSTEEMAGKKRPDAITDARIGFGWVSERLGIPKWGQLLILFLVAIFVFTGRAYFQLLDKLNSIDKQLAYLDGKLGIQLAQQRINELEGAIKSGDSAKVENAVEQVRSALHEVASKKAAAPQDFFTMNASALDQAQSVAPPPLASQVFNTKIALAEYRSALEQFSDI